MIYDIANIIASIYRLIFIRAFRSKKYMEHLLLKLKKIDLAYNQSHKA